MLLWLGLLAQIVQLEVQSIVLPLHQVELLRLLAPLGLLLKHGLEALPHDVVLVLQAALVPLNPHQLVLSLRLLGNLHTQLLLGCHLGVVLQRLHDDRIVLLGRARLLQQVAQLQRQVRSVLASRGQIDLGAAIGCGRIRAVRSWLLLVWL